MDNLKTVRENDFVGYNDTMPPEYLPKGVLADAVNCFCRTTEIIKRTGYTVIGDDLGSAACTAIQGVEFADGTKRVYVVFNGAVKSWSGSGNWTNLGGTLSATDPTNIVVANNNVYFFDGTNTVVKVTSGNVLSTVAAIPIGKFASWFHNQLHVAGISGSPNKLRSSDIGDPENHSTGAFSNIDVNPNDGDIITGLRELKDELMVFKRNRIWSMTGFGTSALTLSNLNEKLTGFGTLSHQGIINTGDDLLYIGFKGNNPVIRSIKRTRYGVIVDAGIVSKDIETTLTGLNTARLHQAAGIYDGRYAWFAVPNGASTYNNLCLTLDTTTLDKKFKGWTRHTGINASCFTSFAVSTTPQLFFGEASADSKVYVMDNSTSDNGTAIAFSIKTRRYGSEAPELKKKYKWLYVSAEEVGNYNVTIDKSVDGFSYDNLGTLNLSGSGAALDSIILDSSRLGATDMKRDRFTIAKSRNLNIQFNMYDSSATSSVNIRNWELLYQLKNTPIDTQ